MVFRTRSDGKFDDARQVRGRGDETFMHPARRHARRNTFDTFSRP